MFWTIHFIYVDHESDLSADKQRTVIEAETAALAAKKFFAGGEMAGCYIEEITPFR